MNRSELAAIHARMFGIEPSRNVSRKELIHAIEKSEPLTDDWPDLLRDMNLAIIDYYPQIRPQLKCHGLCALCPVGLVAACIDGFVRMYPAAAKIALDASGLPMPPVEKEEKR